MTLRSREKSFRKIWTSTCRIDTGSGSGSGFFTNGGREGIVVVTNAHVVDQSPAVSIEWMDGIDIVSLPGRLIAIDYVHDLAILKPGLPSPFLPNPPTLPSGLVMGSAPLPGQRLYFVGYPHGVETPRVATAVASGYDVYQSNECEISAVVLDANVNRGNSGGPVCGENEIVVGVIAALKINDLILKEGAVVSAEMRDALEALCQHLGGVSGVAYAIHPGHVKRMLATVEELRDWARTPYEKVPPAERQMRRRDFVALQRLGESARGREMSPIGVFSVDDDRTFYAGWANQDRVKAERNAAWNAIAPDIKRVGRHFILRGYDVVAYHKRRPPYQYGYWAVAVRLQVTD